MALTFLVSLLAIALLFATMVEYELTIKHTRAQVRALRRRLLGDEAERRSARPRSAAPAPALQAAAARASAGRPG
jgi:heme exporter protein C